jgi:quercetin dioxygenase-like cupin family protein
LKGKKLKIISLLLIYLLLFLSLPTFAIENEEDIKVTKIIETDTSWEKTKIIYPNGDTKITALLVEMQPKAKIQMHHHEVPSFGYILEGKITVQSESGDIKTFSKGDVVIEMINKKHSGMNPGDSITKFIVIYMGTEDLKNTIIE